MPYISPEDRVKFDEVLKNMPEMKVKGELEYCIYRLMNMYMANKDEKYSNLHDTVYAAVHCGDEFRRHRLDKREDKAIEKNGNICGYPN